VRLKHFAIVAQTNEIGTGYDADFALTQRNRIATIFASANSIETKEISGHWKAGYLSATIFGKQGGLEKSRLDRVNRFALRTGSIQHFVPVHAPPVDGERSYELPIIMRTAAETNLLKPAQPAGSTLRRERRNGRPRTFVADSAPGEHQRSNDGAGSSAIAD
jgi:hypothetical protein